MARLVRSQDTPPSFESRQAKSYKEVTGRTYPWRVTDFRIFYTAIDYRLGQDTFNFQSGVRLPVAVPVLGAFV